MFFLWLRLFKFFAASPWLGLFQVRHQQHRAPLCNTCVRASSHTLRRRSLLLLSCSCCCSSRLLTGRSPPPPLFFSNSVVPNEFPAAAWLRLALTYQNSPPRRARSFSRSGPSSPVRNANRRVCDSCCRHLLVAMDYEKLAAAAPFAGAAGLLVAPALCCAACHAAAQDLPSTPRTPSSCPSSPSASSSPYSSIPTQVYSVGIFFQHSRDCNPSLALQTLDSLYSK